MIWILLTLVYGLLKGGREISKKKAMDRNSVMEVLLIYTLIGFLIVVPRAPHAMGMEPYQYGLVLIKSFSIFLAWMMGFHALKHLPVSLYGVLDLSRVLLGTLLGVIVLHEVLMWNQILGLSLVALGLLALRFNFFDKIREKHSHTADTKKEDNKDADAEKMSEIAEDKESGDAPEGSRTKFVVLAFGSCVLNSVSGLLDKILMKDINSSQMQFWYMLFLLALYSLYVLVTKTKIRKEAFKNGWIWLMSIMFVIGDASLFIANANPDSSITVMTVVKQSACFVTILGGKFVFHEKGIAYRLFCASIILIGIIMSVLYAA
ncbi:MAG: EamA family transporter [Clostridiales bacterium]|nr:EamA family transporter [Clostridiales bacterium]MBR4819649.1 EamA family transporter [Clostridiales bacterium]